MKDICIQENEYGITFVTSIFIGYDAENLQH